MVEEVVVVPCVAMVMVASMVVSVVVMVEVAMVEAIGHRALRCYKRFDASYSGEEKQANAAATSYNVDTDWYIDTGATDHITSELDKLTM
jgi:hypothetical protein